MRFRSTIAVATAAALAALGGTAIAGDDDGDRGGRDGRDDRRGTDFKFATIKDGTRLVVFDDRRNGSCSINGLLAGERVVGIDVRPTDGDGATNGQDDGRLYGVGKVGTTGYVFEIDSSCRVQNRRTLQQDPTTTGAGGPFTGLRGDSFGVDFNPAVDRLRITSDAEQNLRVNVDTGNTIQDRDLQYPQGDRRNNAPTSTPVNPSVVGAGYTFAPFGGQTALYDVDTANPDFFVLQNPPNAGTLNSIGPIGIDAGGQVGYDIAGKTTFQGFELAQQGDRAVLYELRFDRNGAASDTGTSLRGTGYDGLAVLDGYGDGR